jgi:uncharacterized protein
MNNIRSAMNRSGTTVPDMSVDAGLRSFMLGVYNKMGLGLLLSALLAYAVGSVPVLTQLVFGTPLKFVVMFGPIGLLLVASFAMKRPSPLATGLVYWTVASLIGASLGAWVVSARMGLGVDFTTIGKAFFVTASAFGGLSLWGYTTRRDLSAFGTFLMMGVIGLVVASVVNMFVQSSMMGFVISLLGVLVFAGLTAFDTQRLKHEYYTLEGDQRAMSVATNWGALSLYLNFVNLFQFILALMSGRSDE